MLPQPFHISNPSPPQPDTGTWTNASDAISISIAIGLLEFATAFGGANGNAGEIFNNSTIPPTTAMQRNIEAGRAALWLWTAATSPVPAPTFAIVFHALGNVGGSLSTAPRYFVDAGYNNSLLTVQNSHDQFKIAVNHFAINNNGSASTDNFYLWSLNAVPIQTIDPINKLFNCLTANDCKNPNGTIESLTGRWPTTSITTWQLKAVLGSTICPNP